LQCEQDVGVHHIVLALDAKTGTLLDDGAVRQLLIRLGADQHSARRGQAPSRAPVLTVSPTDEYATPAGMATWKPLQDVRDPSDLPAGCEMIARA
jgi:hypothetical protein